MQQGSVIQSSRKGGSDVWQFRWSEKDLNGNRVYRKRVIVSVEEYSDEAAVRQAASGLLSDVNLRFRQARIGFITVDQLCEHFEQREMRSGASLWSVATARTYRGYIRRWIRPRWGSRSLDEIKAVEVEAWLRGLDLARGSRPRSATSFPSCLTDVTMSNRARNLKSFASPYSNCRFSIPACSVRAISRSAPS